MTDDELLAARRKAREWWVREHGSSRLKKALEMDLLEKSLAVYREERLALERPGWVWQNQHDVLSEILNPSEEALDVLWGVRQYFPAAELVSVNMKLDPHAWHEAVKIPNPFGEIDPTPRPALRFVRVPTKDGQ